MWLRRCSPSRSRPRKTSESTPSPTAAPLLEVARHDITGATLERERQQLAAALTVPCPKLKLLPEDTYLREVLWDAIVEALDELPEEQRRIFILNELEDRSFRDISEETGISINTLLSRKRYAILALRKKLQQLYDEM